MTEADRTTAAVTSLVAEINRILQENETLRQEFVGLYEYARQLSQQSVRMGPLAAEHPLVADAQECPGCKQVFGAGELVTLVPIGPGDDTEAQERARDKRPYNAISLPAHWVCVTGEVE